MQRPCDVCGDPYEAKRATSRYCSSKCRVAKARGAVVIHQEILGGAPVELLELPPAEADAVGPVAAAVLSELTAVDRHKTSLGQASLALARRVDIGRDTGAGLAALVKQLEATVRAATADVKSAASPLDQMRDELAQRRAGRSA